MISDNQLYSLAVFLGSASMLLIVLYHFLETNAKDTPIDDTKVNTPAMASGEKQTASR